MTFHLDWTSLDSTVTEAVREYINTSLDAACKKRFEQQQEQKGGASSLPSGAAASPSATTVKSAASVSVTKIWWGVEPPLLEILEIDQPSSSTPSQQQQQQQHSSMMSSSSNLSLPRNETFLSSSSRHSLFSSPASGPAPLGQSGESNESLASSSASPSNSQNNNPHGDKTNPHHHEEKTGSTARPSSLLEAVLGKLGLQIRVHLVQSGAAGFELAMLLDCDVSLGGGCHIGCKLPMLFDVSNFHFDLVFAITLKADGVTVMIEPDRFGGDGAEALLSSLSLQMAIGGGATTGGGDGNNRNKRGRSSSRSPSRKDGGDSSTKRQQQQESEEVYIDKDVARSLALRELRAILKSTMLKGITIPIGSDSGAGGSSSSAADANS